jgi:hypothetical protein
MAEQPKFFEAPEDFRAWLNANPNKEAALLVGFYKVATGRV